MFILYTGLWVGLALPISLSIAFSLLKPIVIKDTTGVSMLVIAIIVGLVNTYLGIKVIEKYIQPSLENRKEKRHFP
ncbi:hypothetical protein [Cytobacillus sp. IB215665]|uniref:hypothetical protein n=1 Tax=Cytobacillus sp. IB215665 TaxID=3097357 RepID=UPI002A10C28E|nr:hypothetical protein [Cytobacillus sp. IB215665]MDX8366252.1 hypothetical protein [Cytobacillus sp. IB215665]